MTQLVKGSYEQAEQTDTTPVKQDNSAVVAAAFTAAVQGTGNVTSSTPPASFKSAIIEPTHDIPETPDPLLVTILRTKRAHTSNGDTNFRLWLHKEIERKGFKATILAEGCVFVQTDLKSDTLFSCHVDTCHGMAESDGSMQELAYDPTFGHIVLGKGSPAGCLGADDGVGIYIMLKMIEAKVPGGYLFHTGEERGGIGSRAVLAKHKDILENFSRAVAFDRPRTSEVIIAQGGVNCASVEAGKALAAELNKHNLAYDISYKGTFTDTKVYISVIEECFNIGVGYEYQHTPREYLDVGHTEALLSACKLIKWDDLPVKRKAAPEPASYPTYGRKDIPKNPYQGGMYDDMYGGLADDGPPFAFHQGKKKKKVSAKKVAPEPKAMALPLMDELEDYTQDEWIDLATADPDLTGKLCVVLLAKIKGLQREIDYILAAQGVQ